MSEQKRYLRFGIARRIEHLVLLLTFTTLGVTGLVQKYSLNAVADFIIKLLGGIETTRVIHHIAAGIFLVGAVYHLIVMGYKLYIQRAQASMMPGIKDIRDLVQGVAYNLGLIKEGPKMGRYNFVEKAEYWAMAWGLVVMALTGIMMWNPIATTNLLPGQIIPAAKSAHGNEAVLAVLAIILWHFYSVHIKKWNWAMIKGTLSRKEMEEEHALELDAIEAGSQPEALPAKVRAKRLWVFAPAATLVSLVLIFAMYQFLTFEKTAITTAPQDSVGALAYQRQTPTPLPTRSPVPTQAPQPTIAPTAAQPTARPTALQPTTVQATANGAAPSAGAASWNGGIGQIFQDNCTSCHGASATAGLDVTSYASLMKGGTDGVIVVPGSPDTSLLIQKMSIKHARTFSDADLLSIKAWIQAGAPEK